MGKGAQFEDYSRRGVQQSTTVGMASTSKVSDTNGAVMRSGKGKATVQNGYDVSLVNGRTGGGLEDDGTDVGRAKLAEMRLLETQQVLVQERLQREIAESVLAETAKALSAVRRAAVEHQGSSFIKDGQTLKGGTDEIAEILNQKLNLLRSEYDVLKAGSATKEIALRTAENRNEQLVAANGGDYMQIAINVTEMTTSDQDELVLNSKTLLDRAKQLEQYVGELMTVDEERIRTIAELISVMDSRQSELKDKLRDHGLLDDDEYDDKKVWELSQGLFGGEGRMLNAEAKAALGHMLQVEVTYDGPATSPLGKNFYVTRTASVWDRWFGVHC
mgnify:FL=1